MKTKHKSYFFNLTSSIIVLLSTIFSVALAQDTTSTYGKIMDYSFNGCICEAQYYIFLDEDEDWQLYWSGPLLSGDSGINLEDYVDEYVEITGELTSTFCGGSYCDFSTPALNLISIEILEIDPQIGDECITEDGDMSYYDCDMQCVHIWTWDYWLGDEYCDDGNAFNGPDFDCPELGYDCGDCNEDWDGTDPLGFCAEENDYLIEFTIQNVDVENETFEILLTNYTDITSLQFDQVGFDIDEVSADFTGTWIISANNPPPVLIWELFGEPLPHGEYFVYIGGEITADEICIENAIFSDSNGEQIDPEQVYIGPCVSNLDCLEPGDYTGDNEINILDIVGIVNCIINNLSCPCADLNDDGAVNVLDIVMLANMILGGG